MVAPADTAAQGQTARRFEIFRGADRRDYGEHGLMEMRDLTAPMIEALTEFTEQGGAEGQAVSMLYSRPGMSLTHAWFKSGYPLPLHAHESDCLYYLLAGSVRMGDETLGPGDGFFVGSSVPYTYEVGPEGAQVLEFRNTDQLNIRFLAKGRAAWDKTVARLREKREGWRDEPPPGVRTPVEVDHR